MAIDRVKASAILDGSVTSADLDTNIAIAGNLTVDTNTLHVDSANNRVGVGTASPSSLLDVDKSQDAETNIEITNTNAGSAAQVRTKYTTDGGLFTVGKTSDAHVYGGDAYIHNVDNTNIRFATNDIERLRILSTGGITFNGDTAAANALDDYEEGSWTPSIGGNATYNAQTGKYTKIGNQVTCWFNIYVNSLGTGSHVTVTGLPFTVSNITEFNANGNSMTYWSNINTACTYLAVKLDKNTTQFQFTNTTAATTTVGTPVSVYKDGADTYGTFTYRTG